jgi:hypothetical protein
MPEIRISDRTLLEELARDLRERGDVVVEAVADDRLLVQVLGSYSSDGMRLALYLRLRAWEAAQRARGHEVFVEIVE